MQRCRCKFKGAGGHLVGTGAGRHGPVGVHGAGDVVHLVHLRQGLVLGGKAMLKALVVAIVMTMVVAMVVAIMVAMVAPPLRQVQQKCQWPMAIFSI